MNKDKQKKTKKTIGILNEGKGNRFINNEFHNLDVGIHDKGKDTVAEGNKFFDGGVKKN